MARDSGWLLILGIGVIGIALVSASQSDPTRPPTPVPPRRPPPTHPPIGTDIPGHPVDEECFYFGVDAQNNPIRFNHWKLPKTDRGPTMGQDFVAYKTVNGSILVMTSDGKWMEPRLPSHVHQEFLGVIQLWKEYVDKLLTTDEFRSIPESWIWAIMWAESRGKPNAKSKCGALGLMQVMPFHFGPKDSPLEPNTNLRFGAKWILNGFKRMGSDRDLPRTASHYNAGGPYTNAAWLAAGKNKAYTTQWGVPAEKGYIDSVVSANNTYLSLIGAGLTMDFPPAGDPPAVS